jgi:hypothetical protein
MNKYISTALLSCLLLSASAHASQDNCGITEFTGVCKRVSGPNDDTSDATSTAAHIAGMTYVDILDMAAEATLQDAEYAFFSTVVSKFKTLRSGDKLSFDADDYKSFYRLNFYAQKI